MKTLIILVITFFLCTPVVAQDVIGCEHHVSPGDLDYCLLCGPCEEGEGDCDNDSECADGLECRLVSGVDRCEYPTTIHYCSDGTRPVIDVLGADTVEVTCTGK